MPKLSAISRTAFLNKSWKRNTSYAYAAKSPVIPIVNAEISKISAILPIGLVQLGESFKLVAITGLRPDTNLCIDLNGKWLLSYVPAALRAYPFRLVKPQDSEQSVLCIDEESGLVTEGTQGEAFFDAQGAPSSEIKKILEFLTQTERNSLLTQAAVDALQSAGVIQPWDLVHQSHGEHIAVKGLHRVDEDKLNALDAAGLHVLKEKGALALAYAQLLSMNQLRILGQLEELRQKQAVKSTTPPVQGIPSPGFGLLNDAGTIKFSSV